jgi:internalin A
LTSLTVIYLHNNLLTTVPAELGQLTALTEVYLHNNRLRSVPAEFGRLTALLTLLLDNNDLPAIPPELGELTSLTLLHLENNQLTEVPAELGQLTALTHLFLQNNQLTAVPTKLGQLSLLKLLDISCNQLAAVPAELGQLRALALLDLSFNQLASIPVELGESSALTHLFLGNNRLVAVPAELGQLTSLQRLTLEDNALISLPISLQDLVNLRELRLHGNDALGLPMELLGPRSTEVGKLNPPANPQTILDFYFARQAEGSEAMREVRVLLVGRGRVGKTSLLKVLRGEKLDPGEKETPGITVLPLPLRCAQGTATAHAWDFGGQEFLHGTHQIFLSERCIYLLVLEGRESNWETETDYWLRFIQSFGGDSPVVVALNKYDSHAFTVDRFRLQEKCPQIAGFVPTDALTGRGIAELRALLETTVNGMPDVWLGVPRRWHRVKERLRHMATSFLDYKEYLAVCAREQVTDEGQQASLAETLHRLGIALNFRDHHRLRETSVLKPKWVTKGIYGLLRFLQKRGCNGVLERAWLAEALPSQEYPTAKHGFVMELMEKFEVAFALEKPEAAGAAQEPERWLLPELLPEVQPAAFAEFRATGVKRLRFTYPEALPPGLLPRFIVRTHEMSEGQARWRSGVVLAWGEERALVRLDRTQRQATVEVVGASQEGAQGIFDIIRAHLVVLHGMVTAVEELQISEQPAEWVRMKELRMAEREKDEVLKVTIGQEPNERRLTLPVGKTLDAVESPEARAAEGPTPPRRVRLFVSYAHADARKLKTLSTQLTILGRRGFIQPWEDKQLIAGEDWHERIMDELAAAEIVLLIYSDQSQASAYVQDKEIPKALVRMDEGKCVLIPVPLDGAELDPANPQEQRLKKLMTATWNAKPVLKYARHADAWREVGRSIRATVEARRAAWSPEPER